MRSRFKFLLNMAILGFTLGRLYTALQGRLARTRARHV
jgi:hypothetical protein